MKYYRCQVCNKITTSTVEAYNTKIMCPDCWELYLMVCSKPLTDCINCDQCQKEGREEK